MFRLVSNFGAVSHFYPSNFAITNYDAVGQYWFKGLLVVSVFQGSLVRAVNGESVEGKITDTEKAKAYFGE